MIGLGSTLLTRIAALRTSGAAAPLVVIVTAFLSVWVVRETGGRSSDLLPLVNLPIILAVVSCSFERTVILGLFVSFLQLYFQNPGSLEITRVDAVRALTLNTMALIGAVYARSAGTKRGDMEQERTRMLESMEEKDALLNASQIINSQDKLEHAINSTLLLVPKLVHEFRCAAIFFADETTNTMQLFDVIGVGRTELRFERFNFNSRSFGWQAGDPNPCYIPNTAAAQNARVSTLDPGAGSLVCVALRSHQSFKAPIGMLFVSMERPYGFSESQVNLLQAFADRIGYPLQKIRVQQGLEGLAFTDGMTGLHNFRYFRNHLEDEMKRSARYKRPLSLIILDVDDFKRVNDRYGHQAGDRLLIAISSVMQASVRETDLLARYGGEEFIIISPETLTEEAVVVTERIRLAVEAEEFDLDPGVSVCVTVSAGVATYPVHALDDASLLHAADHALYRAKELGKNRTVSAEIELPASRE